MTQRNRFRDRSITAALLAFTGGYMVSCGGAGLLNILVEREKEDRPEFASTINSYVREYNPIVPIVGTLCRVGVAAVGIGLALTFPRNRNLYEDNRAQVA